MKQLKGRKCFNKLSLQVLAMVTMLIDHIGLSLLPDIQPLRCIGRLAFPIFAWFIAEGYTRTNNFRKYLLRMALFSLLAEIPFNLMHTGDLWMPGHQNVLWTFCIALLCLRCLDKLRERHRGTILWADIALVSAVGFAAGEIFHTDYGGWGVLLVIGFSLSRELSDKYRCGAESLCAVVFALVGFGGIEVYSLLSLPLLLLYSGEQGPHNKMLQYSCYAFYPAHLLILGLISHIY